MGGRAAHQLPQSVLLSLHVPAEARPRLKARTRERKSIGVDVCGEFGAWHRCARRWRGYWPLSGWV